MPLKRSRVKLNNITQDLKPLTVEAFRREGEEQNSRAYWILGVNRLPLSEGEGCFQCEDLSIRKQGEGLSRRVCHTGLNAVPQGLGVEKKYRHCERMRSNPEKHQASSCTYNPKYIYPCHTVLDTVPHKLGRQDLLTARHSRAKHGNPAFLNYPQISNKTDRFRIKSGIIINRNNFPFSTFHFQFFAGARRRFGLRGVVSRVRFNAPQLTTKEVLC